MFSQLERSVFVLKYASQRCPLVVWKAVGECSEIRQHAVDRVLFKRPFNSGVIMNADFADFTSCVPSKLSGVMP